MSGDAFGQTAYAPQGGAPMPPTGAMSGFGAEQPPPAISPQFPLPPPLPQTPSTQGTKATASGQPEGRRTLAGFLVSFQDDPLGKFWPLWQGKNVVGRAETGQKVDIEIAHGTTSTHHATLEFDGVRVVLSDLGSTNGTFHNEEAIGFQGRRELRDGDKIRFGGFSVILFSVAARA
jgi:pSer/pThr/pTyr-binding forkhead associated (FHA) protein